jgi:CheY-like chemotaxis protein
LTNDSSIMMNSEPANRPIFDRTAQWDVERVGEQERPVRVLVVDDEPLIVEMLTMGLTYEGFEVSVARTGYEALDVARNVRPDLVVLDIMLPGMDGVEVCRRLRAWGVEAVSILERVMNFEQVGVQAQHSEHPSE